MGRINYIQNFISFQGKILSVLLFLIFFSNSFLAQTESVDSIVKWQKEISYTKDEIRKLDLLNRISTELCNEKPKESLVASKKQEELAIKLKDNKKLIDAYLNASVASRELALFKDALDLNLKAINVAESTNDTLNTAHCYNYLAIFYHISKDYKAAEKYYLKSFKLFCELKDLKSQYIIQNNLSDIYLNTERKAEAESSLEKSITGRKAMGNSRSIGIGYYSLGSFLVIEKKFKAALLVLDSSLSYLKKSGDNFFYYQTLILKGNALELCGRYKESNDILLKATENEMVKSNPDLLLEAYGAISVNFEKLNNSDEALKYARLEKVTSDSVYLAGSQKALKEAQAKFDTEKQEKEIELLNKEKKISETELSRQKTIRNTFITGSLIVIIFSLFIFRQYRAKKLAHQIISRQKTAIDKQHKELEEKQKEIVDSIKYAKRIQQTLMPTEKYIHKNLKTLK